MLSSRKLSRNSIGEITVMGTDASRGDGSSYYCSTRCSNALDCLTIFSDRSAVTRANCIFRKSKRTYAPINLGPEACNFLFRSHDILCHASLSGTSLYRTTTNRYKIFVMQIVINNLHLLADCKITDIKRNVSSIKFQVRITVSLALTLHII